MLSIWLRDVPCSWTLLQHMNTGITQHTCENVWRLAQEASWQHDPTEMTEAILLLWQLTWGCSETGSGSGGPPSQQNLNQRKQLSPLIMCPLILSIITNTLIQSITQDTTTPTWRRSSWTSWVIYQVSPQLKNSNTEYLLSFWVQWTWSLLTSSNQIFIQKKNHLFPYESAF